MDLGPARSLTLINPRDPGRPQRRQGPSYKTSYTVAMADTITFRTDEDASKALEVLTKDGTAVSVAVRSALIEAARRKAGAAIRTEAQRLGAIRPGNVLAAVDRNRKRQADFMHSGIGETSQTTDQQ